MVLDSILRSSRIPIQVELREHQAAVAVYDVEGANNRPTSAGVCRGVTTLLLLHCLNGSYILTI